MSLIITRSSQPKCKSKAHKLFFFPSLRETHGQKAKIWHSNTTTLHEVILSPKWVPVVVATSQQMGCFLPKLKCPNIESNQVHRRLWLETHAAFLSYDLITRLFSSRVKGAGLSRLYIVLSYTFSWKTMVHQSPDVYGVWQWTWDGSSDGAATFLKQLVPVKTSPWELHINQIIAPKKWRLGVGGMIFSRCWKSRFGTIWKHFFKEILEMVGRGGH